MQAVKKIMPTKVPLSDATITKCRCGYCPVQGESRCVKGLEERLPQNRKKEPIPGDEIPGVYCSHGEATCKDLKFKNPCGLRDL